jgi:replication factor C small subunit
MPHLLLAGRQGIGKTACVTALAREIYGDEWQNNMMELNASSDRGIDVIRDQVKERAMQGPTGDHDFQLIFMDEADSLTSQAQAAFRRTMEDYSDVTRFVLSCNWASQIIDPLQSRCAVFRMSPLADNEIRSVLLNVVEQEGIEVEEGVIDNLITASRGDARNAIMTLQQCALNGEITADDVEAVVGVVDDRLIQDIAEQAVSGDLAGANERLDQEVLKKGVGKQALCDSFLRVVKNLDVPDYAKAKMQTKIADCDWRVGQGANPNVQFHSLLADLHAAPHLPEPGKEKIPEEVSTGN